MTNANYETPASDEKRIRERIVDLADELLAESEYQDDSSGSYNKGIKNIFGKQLLRRRFLPLNNYSEEIVIDERCIRMFGKTKRLSVKVHSRSDPG